jgi:diguanylate cyclase (GGDEF)-like protein/PAS domain S-box-containing protein
VSPRIERSHIIHEAVRLLSYLSNFTRAIVLILAVCLAISVLLVLFIEAYSVYALVVEAIVSASALAIGALALFAKSFSPIHSLQAISVAFLAAFVVNIPHTLLGLGLIEGLPLALRIVIEVLFSAFVLAGTILMLRSCNIRLSPRRYNMLVAVAVAAVAVKLVLMASVCDGYPCCIAYFSAHLLKASIAVAAFWLFIKYALGEPFISLFRQFRLSQVQLLRQIQRLKETEAALARSRDYYLSLFDEFPALIWRSGTDGKLNYFNTTWLRFTGRSLQEEIGDGWSESIHPGDVERWHTVYEAASRTRSPFEIECRLRRYDGKYRYILSIGRPFNDLDGRFAGYIGSCYDVTDRKESEKALRLTEFSLDNSGVCTYWIGSDGSFLNANRAACEKLGYTKNQLMRMKIYDIDSRLDETTWGRYFDLLRVDGRLTVESSHIAGDGRCFAVEVHLNYLKYGGLEYNLAFAHDVTERRRVEEEIKFLTFRDRLTGLYNRAYFEEELARLDTDRQLPLSIVIGDVNGLRLINDTLGREAGNEHLIQVAKSMQQACRKEDILARWGGDEFAILLPRTGENTAHEICHRIVQTCRANSVGPISLSIALGYGTKTDPSQSVHEIMSMAESWMYRQKFLDRTSYRNALISSLRETLNAKTHETHEHATRLENLALMVGRAINLSARELDDLSLLAALHDIGKVGIPDSILNKPGELTEDEWEIMKTHVEIGHRIASSSADLAHIAEAILSHHERWDGEGYPRGLKGDEIPLIAKILAVVDAYDAITNDRPHSIARSSGAALDELMRCAGTHFDPQLVEVFARLMETQGEVAASEHAEALERTEASGRAEASERAKPSDRAI